jgi:hypothetical protein
VFEVTFGMEIDSQTETDPSTATIGSVTGGRAPAKVTVENGGANYKTQRAHVTANHVHIAAMERLITGETWFGAWEAMRGAWQFSRAILNEWYAADKLGSGVNAGIKKNLYAILGSADNIVANRLSRNNIPLQTCWFVRPLQGTEDEKSKGRHYFDHDPQPTDYDTTQYGAPQRWVPNLGTEYVAALAQNLTDWVDCRGQFPWTSVDTDSFRTGEAAAVTRLDNLVAERHGAAVLDEHGDAVLDEDDQKLMAGYMLGTYDFFPPTLTKARTLYHAAGTAARHVVEYYYYCPDIEEAWRGPLAAAFLAEWKAWVEDTVAQPPPNLNMEGLTALMQSWPDVTNAYNQYYASFKTTLP